MTSANRVLQACLASEHHNGGHLTVISALLSTTSAFMDSASASTYHELIQVHVSPYLGGLRFMQMFAVREI